MRALTTTLRRVAALFRRRQISRDVEDELSFHLEMRASRERAEGLDRKGAEVQARRRFGPAGVLQEECRDEWTFAWLENLLQDLAYSARSLRRNPMLTSAIVLTIALGVGANTAVFSAIDAALFRPFDLPHPEQLTALFSVNQGSGRYVSSSYPDFKEFRERVRSFQGLSAYVRFPLSVSVRTETFSVPVECVTGDYFTTLQLSPRFGRLLTQSDEYDSVAVISDRMWEQRFGSDPDALGSAILIEDQPFRIVGVAPQSFRGTNLNWHEPPDIWIPLTDSYRVLPRLEEVDILNQRSMAWLVLVGRLHSGVSLDRAETELKAVAADISQLEPEHKVTIAAFPLSRAKFWPSYREVVVRTLAVFSAAGVLVLLLACANVANLLLARGLARQRETAIRLSIGVSKLRLIQLHLAEALLLMVPSFGGALFIAYGMQRVLPSFPAALGISLALELGIDGRALTVGGCLAMATAVFIVLAPLAQSQGTNPVDALRPAVAASAGVGRLRRVLVIVQIAFSTVLLISGAIVGQSLVSAYSMDIGFRPSNLLVMTSSVPLGSAADEDDRSLIDRLSSLPGVESVAFASHVPLSGPLPSIAVAEKDGGTLEAKRSSVGPSYFDSLGIRLLAGHTFRVHGPEIESRAAIINQTLRDRLGLPSNPVGHTFLIRERNGSFLSYEIIGLAQDSRYESIWEDPTPFVYRPAGERESNVVMRAAAGLIPLQEMVREEWRRTDEKAVISFATGQSLLDSSLQPQRLTAAILGCFGTLAVLLAALGVGGVMAYHVKQGTREIGVRMAIGASPAHVLQRILSKSLILAGVGIVLGALPAFLWAPQLAFIAKGVNTRGLMPFAVTACLISLVTVAAVLAPAVRAARIDPSKALRGE